MSVCFEALYNKGRCFKLRNKTIQYNRLEHRNMKLTVLAKATLALGILTTGVMTAESQTVHAKVKLDETQRQYYINMLKDYYSQESYESTNISVKSEDYYGSNVLNFNQRNKNFKVFLIGDDRNKYKELMHGRDVFAVPELIDTKGGIYTVGGITKEKCEIRVWLCKSSRTAS